MADIDIGALAERVASHGKQLERMEGEQGWARQHIEALTQNIADTERRLSDKQEAGFREIRGTVERSNEALKTHLDTRMNAVDEHLGKQDEKLDRHSLQWPPAAYLIVGGAVTLAGGLILSVVTHAFGL